MRLLVCGINHNTAPIAIREKLAINDQRLPKVLVELLDQSTINEAVVLSTCNRTEVYCDAETIEPVVKVLLENSQIDHDELEAALYVYRDQDAVEHIMQVACGLDSMLLGEPQILGQLKSAVALANEYQALDHRFHGLFQRVFSLAKEVRTTTEVGVCPVSIASIALRLAKEVYADFSRATVLLLGAGDIMQLTAKYLSSQNPKQVIIASRHLDRAEKVAALCEGQAIYIKDIMDHLPSVDIVMTATASELPILGKGSIESAMQQRANKPMVLIDMAVPRDIEPEVSSIEHVFLHTIDDLKSIANHNVKSRTHAIAKAKASIIEHAKQCVDWENSLASIDTIRAFRDYVGDIREVELAKAQKLLKQGVDPKIVIERLAKALTNKLMHEPSVQMRQAGVQGREDLLSLVQELFPLNH